MIYVEPGFDMYGVPCWYVLQEANLLGIYYNEEEALQAKEQYDN